MDIISFKLERSLKTNNTETIKSEIKDIFILPSLYVGGKDYPIDSVKYWDDVLLLAALINSECRNCIKEEKEVVGQVVRNRVKHDFDGFGKTYYEQISAKSQFSGFKNSLYTGHLFYYNGYYKIYHPNEKKTFYSQTPLIFLKKNGYSINDVIISKDEDSLENYKIAYKIIKNNFQTIPDNIFYFCNSSIATNKKEVARQRKNQVNMLLFYKKSIIKLFKHDIFAYGTP